MTSTRERAGRGTHLRAVDDSAYDPEPIDPTPRTIGRWTPRRRSRAASRAALRDRAVRTMEPAKVSTAFIRERRMAPAMHEPSVAKKTGTIRTSNADVPIDNPPGSGSVDKSQPSRRNTSPSIGRRSDLTQRACRRGTVAKSPGISGIFHDLVDFRAESPRRGRGHSARTECILRAQGRGDGFRLGRGRKDTPPPGGNLQRKERTAMTETATPNATGNIPRARLWSPNARFSPFIFSIT
jgi:hypothetical protein